MNRPDRHHRMPTQTLLHLRATRLRRRMGEVALVSHASPEIARIAAQAITDGRLVGSSTRDIASTGRPGVGTRVAAGRSARTLIVDEFRHGATIVRRAFGSGGHVGRRDCSRLSGADGASTRPWTLGRILTVGGQLLARRRIRRQRVCLDARPVQRNVLVASLQALENH
jgi:hypothetical protein